jgi:hypothetical protein
VSLQTGELAMVAAMQTPDPGSRSTELSAAAGQAYVPVLQTALPLPDPGISGEADTLQQNWYIHYFLVKASPSLTKYGPPTTTSPSYIVLCKI